MADQETQAPTTVADDANRSLRLAIIFSSIVIWIMAIFMINILYSINGKIETLSQNMQTMITMASRRSLDEFQLTDKDGNLTHSFRINPMYIEEIEMRGPEGEPVMDEAPPAPAPAATE